MSTLTPPVPIMCECGNQIYELVRVDGIPLAHAGGGYCRTLRGTCKRCGRTYSYSVSDQQISRAVIACKQLNPGEDEDGE
jgi:hypothetical protein